MNDNQALERLAESVDKLSGSVDGISEAIYELANAQREAAETISSGMDSIFSADHTPNVLIGICQMIEDHTEAMHKIAEAIAEK